MSHSILSHSTRLMFRFCWRRSIFSTIFRAINISLFRFCGIIKILRIISLIRDISPIQISRKLCSMINDCLIVCSHGLLAWQEVIKLLRQSQTNLQNASPAKCKVLMKFPILINHRRIVSNLLISTPIYLTPEVYFTNRKYVSPNINLRISHYFYV